ncbi:cyclin-dependent kinase 2-interacting protein [Stegostoma tigrinum]|uniref:cyclin-dependent kinase 2-interacting protein n=1 Tax=Stegostoma tigrinum TaxID=3053191 RepID=UPI00202B1207|nr:cyclin-dependent kinase 2-interacting protein [Stegostoma tigrinum]
MDAPCPSSGFVTPRRQDLNNSVRKIKDTAADWHNSMLKWETLNDAGFSVANKIVNIIINTRSESEVEAFEEDESSSNLEKTKLQYNKELDEDCTELLSIFDKMTKLVLKMEKLCAAMKGILDLHTHQYGEDGREMRLFHTWPTKYFYEISIQLTEMYKQELQLKHIIVQEIAHTNNSDLMKVELSAWLYQPYIEEKARLLIESMLLETGHRTL